MQYLNHLQNLFAEYEHLQLEYSRLRQRVEENALAGHKNIDNEFANNCSEKGQLAALKIKNDYLEAESVKKNKLYCDLLESFKIDKAKHCEFVVVVFMFVCIDSDFQLLFLAELIANLERENKELKENLEFTLAENEILSESSKEMAEANFKEKREWLKEKEEYEKVVVWSKNINEKMKLYKYVNVNLMKLYNNVKLCFLENNLMLINKFQVLTLDRLQAWFSLLETSSLKGQSMRSCCKLYNPLMS